jgi:osmotically inducible protein OsmC
MSVRKADATWEGNLREGKGVMRLGTGGFEGPYTYASRFEEGNGTNPEELLGAAFAGCYSMALSADLSRAGYQPQRVVAQAQVHLNTVDGKATITRVHLEVNAEVPGIEDAEFQKIAEGTRTACPVARALGAVKEITLSAKLKM